MTQRHLHLVNSKETARTSVRSEPKSHVLWRGRYELGAVLFSGSLTQLVEPVAIPFLRIAVYVLIPHEMR